MVEENHSGLTARFDFIRIVTAVIPSVACLANSHTSTIVTSELILQTLYNTKVLRPSYWLLNIIVPVDNFSDTMYRISACGLVMDVAEKTLKLNQLYQ